MSSPPMSSAAPSSPDTRLRALAAARWRVAISLTVAVIVVYFGFIALIAFNRSLLAVRIAPGLSLGILLGVVVIVASWLLTWIYVHWANSRYDVELRAIAVADRAPGVERMLR